MKSFIREICEPWLDSYGLLTKDSDGGDSLANTYTALYAAPYTVHDALWAQRQHVLRSDLPGVPIRHPNPDKWYSSSNRTSRDQLVPYLCYVASRHAFVGNTLQAPAFWRLLAQHAKHLLLFAWNTRRNHVYADEAKHKALSTADVKWNYRWKLPDLCFADIWATYIRGCINHAPASIRPVLQIAAVPALTALDLYIFLDVLFIISRVRLLGQSIGSTSLGHAINHDRRNTTLMIHFAARNTASPLSRLAWFLWQPYARHAAHSFWTQADEPPIHLAIYQLK